MNFSRGVTEKLKTMCGGKCQTGRKANRSFFPFFFLAVKAVFIAGGQSNIQQTFWCTFNLTRLLNLLTYSSSRSNKAANSAVHLEMCYFLLCSQKQICKQFWCESPSSLVGQVPAAFWTWLSLHLNKLSWLFRRIQPWALDREVGWGSWETKLMNR